MIWLQFIAAVSQIIIFDSDGSAAHRPPKGRAGHRAGGEETDTTGQFCVPRRGSVRRREDGERGTSKSTGRSERVEIC